MTRLCDGQNLLHQILNRREELIDPLPPQRLVTLNGRWSRIAVQVQADDHKDLAAHWERNHVDQARRRLIDSKKELVRVPGCARQFDQAGKWWRTGRRVPPLAHSCVR